MIRSAAPAARTRPRVTSVAVVGATGAVGREVCAALSLDGHAVHGAARRIGTADVPACITMTAVDTGDPAGLDGIVRGAALVVDCAPAATAYPAVAAAAARAGVPVVSAGGPVDRGPGSDLAPASAVLHSAGMAPGLSELLLRRVAHGLGGQVRATTHLGGLDRFSPAGAEDYLAGLGPRTGAGMAWRAGRAVPSRTGARHDADLPPFREPVSLHPVLTEDTVRVLRALGVLDADAFAVFPGAALRAVLARAGGRDAEAVRRAAELDLAGRGPYHVLRAAVDGDGSGADGTVRRLRRTAVLRTGSATRATAAVVTVAADAVLAGRVRSGVYPAADVLDPRTDLDEIVRRAGGSLGESVAPVGDGSAAGDGVPDEERGAL